MIRPPPRPPLFPSTTLFRSYDVLDAVHELVGAAQRPRRDGTGRRGDLHPDVPGGPWPDEQAHLDVMLGAERDHLLEDRKSTRLNSSHGYISYAVFCLKKKQL